MIINSEENIFYLKYLKNDFSNNIHASFLPHRKHVLTTKIKRLMLFSESENQVKHINMSLWAECRILVC
jgi:hypothetical protein